MSQDSRLFEVFDAVVDLAPQAREAELERRCGDDEELKREVRALLASDADPVTDFDRSAVQPRPTQMPTEIGEYEVLSLLGSGGMGVVYEAMQRSPHRKVALKLVRSSLVTDAHVRRFEAEAEVLGWLNHPGIATVYEAGTARVDGILHPYLAMELVVGFPLDRYASRSGLGIDERIALVAQVADAVHHAHQKGVIHRDLKPGNILVDGSGQPKVLDFGIARVTDADLTASRQTTPGEILGTLPYMSPEQVQGDPSALDTRADVYALGVVLYELLAGRKPFDLSSRSVAEAARILVEEEPPPLGRLDERLSGDVEILVAKALEKEKDRRYASAAAFAEDLRRYLASEPIRARPASAAYQIQKFARRNRLLVGGVASTLLALLLGLVGTWTFAVRASDQADVAWEAEQDAREAERAALDASREASAAAAEARRQADLATAVNAFLNEDLLEAVAPSSEIGRGKDVRMREVLDVAAERIEAAAEPDGRFADKPLVEAQIRWTLGDTYWRLGVLPEAAHHLKRARALLTEAHGAENERTLRVTGELARVRAEQRDDVEDVERLLRETIATSERVVGPAHVDTLQLRRTLGALLTFQTRFAEATELQEESLRMSDEALGPDDPTSITLRAVLGLTYIFQLRYEEAETVLLEGIESGTRVLGPEHPDVLVLRAHHAAAVLHFNRHDEAAQLYEEILEALHRVLGPEHPNTLAARLNYGVTKYVQGRLEEGEEIVRDVLERQQRVIGPHHSSTIRAMNLLGQLRAQRGDPVEAAEILTEAIEALAENPAPEPVLSSSMRTSLLRNRIDLEQWAAAESTVPGLELALADLDASDLRSIALVERYVGLLNELAWGVMHQAEGDAEDNLERAILLIERAYELADPVDGNLLDTLALARFRKGRVEEAFELQLQALELVGPTASDFAELEGRLILYEETLLEGE